jgi:uroporphyrinogen-III synthase
MSDLKKRKIPSERKKRVKTILVSQAKPESPRSPYFELEKKFGVQLTFHPFVVVEPVSAKEFRQQKVDIAAYSAIIFTSRYAIDHFFKICDESRVKIHQDTKYFCISEAVALYLQKFTMYRKRKVFFAVDGTIQSLLHIIGKQKHKDNFIVPNSDAYRKDICSYLEAKNIEYKEATLFRTVANEIAEILALKHDLIILFSPGGLRCLMDSPSGFVQEKTLLAAFGDATCKAAEDSGYQVHIKAPLPQAPSMVGAIELYLTEQLKK